MALFGKKNELNYFDILTKQCESCVKGIKELHHFMTLPEGVDKQTSVTAIVGFEKEGDRYRKELILAIQDEFITPIDREDLFALSRRIDDVIDQVDEIKDLIEIFRLSASESMLNMVDLCLDAMQNLYEASQIFETSKSEINLEYTIAAKKDENAVKRLYWKGILGLQESNPSVSEALQVRELCRELDQLANKIGYVADTMGEVKLKMIR
jgi:uncharacterized protein Yka (UPF0111/DUF47 family)